jgi:hypothetical protein
MVAIKLNPAKIEQPPRSDGYRPICDPLWAWGTLLGLPSAEEYRLVWSAARRLDSGHRQIERVREGIETLPPHGSIAGRQAMHEIIGDAELAVMALDKTLDIVVDKLTGLCRVTRPIPTLILQKRPLLERMRDHYSHIDERAFGRVKGKLNPAAEEAWEFPALFVDRKLTDGTDSLGVDGEATELCIAARDHLVASWKQLVQRGRAARGEK